MIIGDCRDVVARLPAGCVDAVVTDPPYPEVDRSYGRLSEAAWHELMRATVREVRRVLTPLGSAVFILQPNSECVGRMRPWLWDFLAWAAREWNVVQDAYWWNYTAPPTVHVQRRRGLLRPSVKHCVWIGERACYRDQDAVLWTESDANRAKRHSGRALASHNEYRPSGHHGRDVRNRLVAAARGGTTPMNLLPVANADSARSAGAYGHGAGTPLDVCRWWVRYLCPPGGTVLDPFAGSGTTAVAALTQGRQYLLVEKEPQYVALARRRIEAAQPGLPLALVD